MKNLSPLLSLILLAAPAVAQPTPTKVPGAPRQRISYVASVPSSIARQMPRGAKTCFYGSFRLSASSPSLALHLFNPRPKQRAEGYFGTYHLVLHLFEPGARRRNGRTSYRLLSTVPVDYRSEINIPSKFAAELLWLDPAKRQQPILKFDCFAPDGTYGPIGDNVLVVFPTGLKHKATVQSLAFGTWFASDSSGQSTTFQDVDPNGLLELHSTLHPPGDYPATQWILRWNGTQFYPVGGPIKGEGIEPGLPYP